MKTRIISAAVGIALLIVTLFFKDTFLLSVVIGLLALIAGYETLKTTKTLNIIPFAVVSALYIAASICITRGYIGVSYAVASTAYAILFCGCVLYSFNKVNLTSMFTAFLMVFFTTYGFSSIISILDEKFGMFLFIIVAFCSWGSDTGAYFAGRALGKHKLAPNLSPKKTVEGVIGGVLFNLILCMLFGAVYQAVNKDIQYLSFLGLIIIAVTGTAVSIVGDLFASAIKRTFKIKDYGNIMPGHGGVLDRFDSTLLVSVYIYTVLQFFVLIK